MPTGRRPVEITHDPAKKTIKVTLPMAQRDFPPTWRFAVQPNVLDVKVIRDRELTGFELTLNANELPQCRTQLIRILPLSVVQMITDGTKTDHTSELTNRTIEVSAQILSVAVGALRQIAKFSHRRLYAREVRPTVPIVPGVLSPSMTKGRKTEKALAKLADSSTGRIPAHRFPQPRLKLVATN